MTIISIRYLHPVDKILGNNQNGESVHISTKEFHINTNFLKGIFIYLHCTFHVYEYLFLPMIYVLFFSLNYCTGLFVSFISQ